MAYVGAELTDWTATVASADSDDVARRLTRRAKQEQHGIIARPVIATGIGELAEADTDNFLFGCDPTGLRGRHSIRLDARFTDQLAPFRAFALDEAAELFRRGRCRLCAKRPDLLDHRRVLQGFSEGFVQPADDIGWRAGRSNQPEPANGFETRKTALGECRHIRQGRQTLRRRHTDGVELTFED